jgi:hypothetical protein
MLELELRRLLLSEWSGEPEDSSVSLGATDDKMLSFALSDLEAR